MKSLKTTQSTKRLTDNTALSQGQSYQNHSIKSKPIKNIIKWHHPIFAFKCWKNVLLLVCGVWFKTKQHCFCEGVEIVGQWIILF